MMGHEYNENVFSVHNPSSILHCVLVGTCSLSAIVIASVKVGGFMYTLSFWKQKKLVQIPAVVLYVGTGVTFIDM
jgi:hypothetical protein